MSDGEESAAKVRSKEEMAMDAATDSKPAKAMVTSSGGIYALNLGETTALSWSRRLEAECSGFSFFFFFLFFFSVL